MYSLQGQKNSMKVNIEIYCLYVNPYTWNKYSREGQYTKQYVQKYNML